MTRTIQGLLGLCAIIVVGMMSLSSGVAQGAFSWLLLNKAMSEVPYLLATLESKKDSQHLILTGAIAGLKVAITCTSFSLKGIMLETGGKLTEGGKAVFTGCKAYKEAPLTGEYKCTVKSSGATAGTVETSEGKGELALHELSGGGKEVVAKIEPKGGPTGTFAAIRLEGAECPLTELNQVHGTLYLKDCANLPTAHELEHLLESVSALTKLYIGGHSAEQLEVTKVVGSGWFFLTGEHVGYLFGAMDV